MQFRLNLHLIFAIVVAIFVTICVQSAPTPQQQQQQNIDVQKTSSSISSLTPAKLPSPILASSLTNNNNNIQVTPQPAATIFNGSPSVAKRNTLNSPKQADVDNGAYSDFFDGKNPFGDDSLWQVPANLVRDIGSSSNKYADNDADNESDEDLEPTLVEGKLSAAPIVAASSPSLTQPGVSIASTDLKAAAGYHHSSPYGHGPSHYDGYHSDGHHYEPSGHHQVGHGSYDGDHHGDYYYGKYYQYSSVPQPYAWNFGYRRGNPYHTIERHEHAYGPKFQTKVKWSDKHGGYGVQVWDYNHSPKHYGHEYSSNHHSGYKHH